MKKAYFIVLVFISVNIFIGCSSSKKSTQNQISPYAGTWSFVYEGIYSGSTEWKIDQDGQFEVTIEVKTDTRTFENYISGEVSETGEVTGHILLSGNRIGSLSGTMKGNNGNGIYKTQRGEGVWKSIKK
jgi:hypothetical protein